MSLFTELKRRNVIRVAIAYAVVAWFIVQAADILFDNFGAPEWVFKVVSALLALGFPVALVLSWAYELTPSGVKRSEDVTPEESATPKTGRRIDRLIVVGLLAVIAVMALERLWFAAAPEPAGVDGAATDRSIAVLPLLNMSPDPENAFFADGISEELLNILAGVEGLRVASRTSAFSFKGKDTPIPEIARQLGVRHVLEGSVRKQGERVRITAQLIDARTDAHLWSESYERQLDDIFRVQQDIARAITAALTDVLGAGKISVAAPTRDMQAYQRFLRGRSLFYQRASLDQAIADLRWVVDRDPEFAEAWAFLAASEHVVGDGFYGTALDREALMQQTPKSVERALALDPTIPIAQAVKGRLLMDAGDAMRLGEGLKLLESAAERVSADTTPRLWYGLALLGLGYPDRAFQVLEEAHTQDPLVAINSGYLGLAHAMLGRREEGARYALRAVELSGTLTYWTIGIAIDASHSGDTDQARELLGEAAAMLGNADGLDQHRADLEALRQALADGADYPTFATRHFSDSRALEFTGVFAPLMLRAHEEALAFAQMTIGSARSLLIHSAWLPALVTLREHPGFFRMMQQSGEADYWQAHGYPLDCQAVESPEGRRLRCGDGAQSSKEDRS